ncbi:MAG: YetF domain-containing protein [Parasphingorhabdus sp.]|uniref:DUF421 domain-containing protein n=1 Tax=Parasphingorhabdus sp. TaxID=2709688 RepID=UPI00300210FC
MFSEDVERDLLLRVVCLAPIALLWVVVNVRVVGLRSFSKMTAFDFVVTVAIGSLLAAAVTVQKWPDFIQSIGSISILLASQFIIARVRIAFPQAFGMVTNDPVILMKDGVFIDGNLRATRVTRADVYGKLREANALKLSEVNAVILETTGDISVLHGGDPDSAILPIL